MTFPFFYLISLHVHFLDTSGQLNASENSLNRKHQSVLKNLLTGSSSNVGDYISNILCTARLNKLKYYVLKALIYGKMDLSISNTITSSSTQDAYAVHSVTLVQKSKEFPHYVC